MTKIEIETYTLNCVKCDSPFTSREAFPTPQLCPNCIATIPKIPHSKRTVIPTVFNTGKVPKPALTKALAAIEKLECLQSKPDGSGLLTDEEIGAYTVNQPHSLIVWARQIAKAQLAQDQAHEQTRVERIKSEVEKLVILNLHHKLKLFGWWQEYWKKELENGL